MSYEIVKQIKIDKENQEVWCKWDSNNVTPRDFTLRIGTSGTRMLRERGREYLDRFILYNYWSGNMQPGTRNRYSNAADWFTRNNKDWNWRQNTDDWDSYELFPGFGDDVEAQREQHRKLLKEQYGDKITTTVDWKKAEFMDALYQAYVERKKIPVAKIGDTVEFDTPVSFRSGKNISRFTLVRWGKQGIRFQEEGNTYNYYNISNWRNRPYRIIAE